jgi:hypothetical protein
LSCQVKLLAMPIRSQGRRPTTSTISTPTILTHCNSGSGFGFTMDYAQARASKCSSCPIKVRHLVSFSGHVEPRANTPAAIRRIHPTTGHQNFTTNFRMGVFSQFPQWGTTWLT